MIRIRNFFLTFSVTTLALFSQSIAQGIAQNTQNASQGESGLLQKATNVSQGLSEDSSNITLPEAMTVDIDSLLNEWKAKNYIYPDTTCAQPDVNPTYDTIVYQQRLARIPAVMELPYNDVVRKYIDQYTTKQRNSVAYMLGAGNFYIPIFEEALDFYGLPLELKYLPVIESALNPVAKSKVGATGLWQFMLQTGKRYGLEVNSLVDERCDPLKATWAAARYLKDLYNIYGDWSLVIAAYNCGPGNVSKAIHHANGVKDYWTIYPYLPDETRGYVPAFIAANYIMNYYCEHNICPMKTKIPIATDTVVVSRDIHINQIVAYCNISKEAIKSLNPQYKTDIIPGNSEPRVLRMTQQAILEFVDHADSIYAYQADQLLTRRTTVPIKEATYKTTTKKKSSYTKNYYKGSKTKYKKGYTYSKKKSTYTKKKGKTSSKGKKRR